MEWFTFSFRTRVYDDAGGPGDSTPSGVVEIIQTDEHTARRALLNWLHGRGLSAEFIELEDKKVYQAP